MAANNNRVTDVVRCHSCGVHEHINLIDAKARPGADPESSDFMRLECIACYGPGWCPTGSAADFKLSVAPGLAAHYAKWQATEVPAAWEAAARKAGWEHGGDCGGFIFHKPTWGSWKSAASWAGEDGWPESPLYDSWRECCEKENLHPQTVSDA